jgi:hypothetical protein
MQDVFTKLSVRGPTLIRHSFRDTCTNDSRDKLDLESSHDANRIIEDDGLASGLVAAHIAHHGRHHVRHLLSRDVAPNLLRTLHMAAEGLSVSKFCHAPADVGPCFRNMRFIRCLPYGCSHA